jgi:hypothetical protein
MERKNFKLKLNKALGLNNSRGINFIEGLEGTKPFFSLRIAVVGARARSSNGTIITKISKYISEL